VVTYWNADLLQLQLPSSGSKAGGDRGRIADFSRQSRRRLLNLLASIDQKASGLPLFVTLTYPGQDWERYAKSMKRHLDNFRRWLVYHVPIAAVVWRLEMQKRGAPHFHLLLFGTSFLDAYKVASAWWRIVDSGQASHLMAGTEVRACKSWRQATAYVAKYMAKPMEGEWTGKGIWELPGRFWGVWGKERLAIVPFAWELGWQETVRFRRILRGYCRSRGYRLRRGGSVSVYIPFEAARRALLFCGAQPMGYPHCGKVAPSDSASFPHWG